MSGAGGASSSSLSLGGSPVHAATAAVAAGVVGGRPASSSAAAASAAAGSPMLLLVPAGLGSSVPSAAGSSALVATLAAAAAAAPRRLPRPLASSGATAISSDSATRAPMRPTMARRRWRGRVETCKRAIVGRRLPPLRHERRGMRGCRNAARGMRGCGTQRPGSVSRGDAPVRLGACLAQACAACGRSIGRCQNGLDLPEPVTGVSDALGSSCARCVCAWRAQGHRRGSTSGGGARRPHRVADSPAPAPTSP